MDISALLEKAVKLTWQRRVLWALGVLLIVLTSSGLFGRALSGLSVEYMQTQPGFRMPASFPGLPPPLVTLGQIGDAYSAISSLGAVGWVGVIVGGVILLVGIGLLALVMVGGLIVAGAEREGQPSPGFGAALGAGRERLWPMVIIASIPAIPVTVAAIVIVIIATIMISSSGGIDALSSAQGVNIILSLYCVLLLLLCPASLVTSALQLLAGLAYRACMLEKLGAIDSLRRAWQVLKANFGPAALLAVLHLGVGIGTGVIVSLPLNLSYTFLPAIAIVWAVQGIARAATMEMWTLAWQGWTEARPIAAEKRDGEG